MRIGFDVSYIQKRRAGIGRHALEVLKCMLASNPGHEFVLHGWSWSLDDVAVMGIAAAHTKLSLGKFPGLLKRFYWNTLRIPAIENLIGAVDVFHSADPFTPPVKRARKVCTVHDLAYLKYPEFFEERVLKWDRHVRKSVAQADAVIVPSGQTRGDVMELLLVPSDKIHIVRPPVNGIFTFGTDAEEDTRLLNEMNVASPYVLFVGTIEPRKNIPTIVRGFEMASSEIPGNVSLVLAGKKGWKHKDSFRAMQTSSVSNRIRYLEYVSERHLAALYRKATCFVYPSFFEGYGFPVLEAMATGIPIITSANSSLREIADGVALLVEPEKAEDIAEAITMLVTNEVRRVEMRQRGPEIVKQFSAESAARKLFALYESLG